MKTQLLALALFLFFAPNTFAQRISFSTDDYVPEENKFELDLDRAAFQFTFMTPPLSTNGGRFYKTANDVSLNTFLGISAGTNQFEGSGFANVNIYYTQGVQVAGFANVSGLVNSNYASNGIQAAGFSNVHGTSYSGIQASGFANISNNFSGLQAAGFANVNKKANNAIELAGFANVNLETHRVFQAAGFANAALKGESKSQVAGFGNIADEVDGIQAAGFINVARKVKGIQLSGFINICDSIDGVAISFINLVRQNGYRSYEFSLSEWAPMQFTFKMGTQEFYNIYSISKLANAWDKYAFGFGFGHVFPLSKTTGLILDVINHSVFSIAFPGTWNYHWNGNNNMIQVKPTIKRCLGNGVCLNFGPTFNYNYGFYHNHSSTVKNTSIQPFWKTLNSSNQSASRLWVGFTAGISIY